MFCRGGWCTTNTQKTATGLLGEKVPYRTRIQCRFSVHDLRRQDDSLTAAPLYYLHVGVRVCAQEPTYRGTGVNATGTCPTASCAGAARADRTWHVGGSTERLRCAVPLRPCTPASTPGPISACNGCSPPGFRLTPCLPAPPPPLSPPLPKAAPQPPPSPSAWAGMRLGSTGELEALMGAGGARWWRRELEALACVIEGETGLLTLTLTLTPTLTLSLTLTPTPPLP